MKKASFILTTMVVLSLLLAACGSANNQGTSAPEGTSAVGTGNSGAGTPALPGTGNETGTPALPNTGASTATPAGSGAPNATGTSMAPATTPSVQTTQEITATAQTTGTQVAPSQSGSSATDISRVSVILKASVQDQKGNSLGKVNDLILNLQSKCADYVVVTPDSSLNLKSSQIAIPWQAFSVTSNSTTTNTNASGPAITLNLDSNVLTNAPAFDATKDMTAPNWDSDLHSFWAQNLQGGQASTTCATSAVGQGMTATSTPATGGTAATATPAAGSGSTSMGSNPSILATKLIGVAVQDAQSNSLGKIQDLILDLKTGAIHYIIVAADESLGIGEKWIPIPVEALAMSSTGSAALTLNVGKDVLSKAPNFDADALPNTSNPGWDSDITTYWSQQGNGNSQGGSSSSGTPTATPKP